MDPEDHPQFPAFVETMRAHGNDSVQMEIDVSVLFILIGALQLATRHPSLPTPTRETIGSFLDGAIASLEDWHPVLGEMARLGNNPVHDRPI